GIDEDEHTRLVLAFFLRKHQTGELVIDETELSDGPLADLEGLLDLVERSVTLDADTVVLNGHRVLFALVCQTVWEAVVRAAGGGHEPSSLLFERLFSGVPLARELYQGNLTDVAQPLREFAAVQDFLAERGLAWRPPSDPEQHGA